ncbi:MAG: hypothetical protein DRJ05_19570, partial [Bacteroidetes bacterium]
IIMVWLTELVNSTFAKAYQTILLNTLDSGFISLTFRNSDNKDSSPMLRKEESGILQRSLFMKNISFLYNSKTNQLCHTVFIQLLFLDTSTKHVLL